MRYRDIAAAIRREADAAHTGRRDGWRLVEVTRRVRTPGGLAFEAGELALCAPGRATTADGVTPTVTCYSRRNRADTEVRARDVRELR